MTRLMREFRIIPLVLIAIGCLFALKSFGLIFDGGYTLGQRLGSSNSIVVTTVPAAQVAQIRSPSVPLDIPPGQPQGPRLSWMQEMFNYPGSDITGSVPAPKPAEKEANKKPEPAEPSPDKLIGGTKVALDQQRPASPGERALLERLQERRQELDARARELELRESMLKAAEKKLETQSTAEKAEEAKSGPAGQRKDKEEADNARFKSVVTMYETMKPKDAAKIFDRLDIRVLLELATKIKPQRMAEIIALMSPEAAERLTMEMAARGPIERAINPASLPKIDGRPNGG